MAQTTATLKLEIPNRTLASNLLATWSEHSGVSLNVLRARVTADDARYMVEVSGSSKAVATIVRQSAPWDAGRRIMNPEPACAPA